MSLVEHDYLIHTLASNRINQAFRVRVLPWRSRRRDHFFDAHAMDALLEYAAVDSIAITNQESRRRIVRKCFDDLLGSPSSRRIRRDVEINDVPPIVP